MDAQYRIATIVRDRRPPKIRELADVAEQVALPYARETGSIYQKTAEDFIRDELFKSGFSLSFFGEGSEQRAQRRLEKSIQFAMAALKGEGRHGQERTPVLKNHPDYASGKLSSALYVPIEKQLRNYRERDDEFDLVAKEGPTDMDVARRFYQRDSRIRSIALSDRAEPICDFCGNDLSVTYGSDAWMALDVHHERPIGNRSGVEPTTKESLKVICCCCHAVLHRKSRISG